MSERKEKKKKKLDLASLSPLSHPLPRRQPLSRAPSCRRPLTPKPDDEPRLSSIQYHYRPGTISAFFSRALARHASRRRSRAPVRVYMDGCFDMMHYGHANALRQAKALGDVLVVGLIPDSQIRMYKVRLFFSSTFFSFFFSTFFLLGPFLSFLFSFSPSLLSLYRYLTTIQQGPPVMNDAERKTMVESLKWVDEVLTDVPYELTPDFLHELFTRHKIDVVVHGDDPCLLPDGMDAYAHAKAQGRFRVRRGGVVVVFFGSARERRRL